MSTVPGNKRDNYDSLVNPEIATWIRQKQHEYDSGWSGFMGRALDHSSEFAEGVTYGIVEGDDFGLLAELNDYVFDLERGYPVADDLSQDELVHEAASLVFDAILRECFDYFEENCSYADVYDELDGYSAGDCDYLREVLNDNADAFYNEYFVEAKGFVSLFTQLVSKYPNSRAFLRLVANEVWRMK